MKNFLSCDWGTSNFRLRLIDTNTRTVVEEVMSEQGIAATHKAWLESNQDEDERVAFYRTVLRNAISKFRSNVENFVLTISGMASSSIGMKEVPYMKFPFHLRADELNIFKIDSDDTFVHPIFLISGGRTDHDIMRGEETILLGCEVKDNEDSIYILPGTHSKHIRIQKGVALDFKTYVTGEMFDLLVQRSVLSNSVSKGKDEKSFMKGLADAQTNNILNSIFSIRVKHVLQQNLPVQNYEYLSGLIIGTELNQLRNSSSTIYIVSEDPLMQRYELGLQAADVRGKVICESSNAALIAGHWKVANSLEG